MIHPLIIIQIVKIILGVALIVTSRKDEVQRGIGNIFVVFGLFLLIISIVGSL